MGDGDDVDDRLLLNTSGKGKRLVGSRERLDNVELSGSSSTVFSFDDSQFALSSTYEMRAEIDGLSVLILNRFFVFFVGS